jgi:hypothetical protein
MFGHVIAGDCHPGKKDCTGMKVSICNTLMFAAALVSSNMALAQIKVPAPKLDAPRADIRPSNLNGMAAPALPAGAKANITDTKTAPSPFRESGSGLTANLAGSQAGKAINDFAIALPGQALTRDVSPEGRVVSTSPAKLALVAPETSDRPHALPLSALVKPRGALPKAEGLRSNATTMRARRQAAVARQPRTWIKPANVRSR